MIWGGDKNRNVYLDCGDEFMGVYIYVKNDQIIYFIYTKFIVCIA